MNIVLKMWRYIFGSRPVLNYTDPEWGVGEIDRSKAAYKIKNDPLEYAKFRNEMRDKAFEETNRYIQNRVEAIKIRTKILDLKEDMKNLQLSIIIAKKQKKRTSDMYREMARIQAEVLRLEAM